MKAWSFLSLSEDARQYHANTGYTDTFGQIYQFDSTVANHAAVAVGDLVLIRDDKYALGFGWIGKIATALGSKTRSRCPYCASTRFHRRESVSPPFRCSNCKQEFDAPSVEEIDVTHYQANYSSTFVPIDVPIRVDELTPCYNSFAVQQAIRSMDPESLQQVLAIRVGVPAGLWDDTNGLRATIAGGFRLRPRKVRIGQQRFRAALLERHGSNCAFSGPQPADALEAAHLHPFSDRPEHDLRSGLLLRRDLHSLFDRFLISIDPTSWHIRVAPGLHSYPGLAALHDEPVRLLPERRPDAETVARHFELATVTH
ncbi:HNH endonuclease [Amnibacterium setariae]|uniref:HNH endonuclease n=1 Tax=Amnibacterium setariae TaxID=2306585 RepID=A0A3A1TUB5_9MICO|nr:HNH endonuclease signature motif containing protein [Amnibacterium setariae]RIX27843.1 HNH endonuclease [Amnibacterium setariae]